MHVFHDIDVCRMLRLYFQNVVATAVGVSDGLDLGYNTKSSVIRLGLMEMIKFAKLMSPSKYTMVWPVDLYRFIIFVCTSRFQ